MATKRTARAATKTRAAQQQPRTAEQIGRTTLGPRPLPELRRTRAGRAPSTTTEIADNGLKITAVRRASSPMVELRLRVPLAGKGPEHAARAALLAETILLGTARRTRQQVDADLAVVGGHLSAHVNPQRLLLSGSVLANGVGVLLDVLADAITSAAYRRADVERERDRLVEHLMIAAAQPATIARRHLQQHRFGDHPAALDPTAETVADVSQAAVRGLHRRAVQPEGSTLILVGDLRPAQIVEAAAQALTDWIGGSPARVLPPPPEVVGGPIVAFHRPDAVQSQTRLTVSGVLRSDETYAAAQLANIIFGGYFSSRLVENLRERCGYTYHAYSQFEFWPERAALTIGYDCATDVTAAALVETWYEISKIAAVAPETQEVEAARQYAIGSLAGSLANQAGYANMLSNLDGVGLDGRWLREHPANLAAATADEIAAAAQRLFAPSQVTGVMVADLSATGAALERMGVEATSDEA